MPTEVYNQDLDFDVKQLSEFIYALNITRRHVASYPRNHPMVQTSIGKLIAVIPKLLESRNEISIGVARDTLVVKGEKLDPANPVFRDLAESLFSLRIAKLTICKELTGEEISQFFHFFQQSEEELEGAGGIEQVLLNADLKGVRAQPIDFSAFSATEVKVVHAPRAELLDDDSGLLWKSFASGMVRGTISKDGDSTVLVDDLDPELLAEIINNEQGHTAGSLAKSYEEAITEFLKETNQESLRGQTHLASISRLGDLVAKLKPELRQRFLNSTLKLSAKEPQAAEPLLARMPRTDLLEAFDKLDAGTMDVPQSLLDILGRLAQHQDDANQRVRVAGNFNKNSDETASQLMKLFSEDRSEYFVPKDYQDALAVMAGAKADPLLDKADVDELVLSLESDKLEKQFSAILLDLLNRGVDSETADAIEHNLDELIDEFLGVGDYASLLEIYTQLEQLGTRVSRQMPESSITAFSRFSERVFADSVLEGVYAWGKPAQEPILKLVEKIGVVFADPLLDRLAVEQSISHRRFFMVALIRIGVEVKDYIATRLDDERWFFVRNLLIVLRQLNNPAVLSLIEQLAGHDHPKVQFEVMSAYLHYGDDRANHFVLNELTSKKPTVIISAVRLAAKSDDRRVIRNLSKLFNRKLPAGFEAEIMSAVIRSLQENATEEALPELEKFLLGKKRFRNFDIENLRVQAVAILGKLGTVDAGIIAGKVAQSATGELARVSEEVLVKIHRRFT